LSKPLYRDIASPSRHRIVTRVSVAAAQARRYPARRYHPIHDMALVLAATMTAGLTAGARTPMMMASRAAVRSSVVNMGLHELQAKMMDGTEIELSAFKGKQVLALNVASR
jgi:hypothetical protein